MDKIVTTVAGLNILIAQKAESRATVQQAQQDNINTILDCFAKSIKIDTVLMNNYNAGVIYLANNDVQMSKLFDAKKELTSM